MTKDRAARLLDYVSGELTEAESRPFVDALFSGELDGDDLTELSALIVGIREAAFFGFLTVLVSAEHADQMRANGYRVQRHKLEPGVLAVADGGEDFDLLFVEYIVDLTGVTEIISEVCDAHGVPFKRSAPTAVPPGAESISGYCARDLALAAAHQLPEGTVTRLYSVEPDGERLLGEFPTRIELPTPDPQA